ncbi:hypothetical protein OBBRIDRAFT_792039 [Obba rivulosa]|uniref:Uncharacterized protein n=1 Tax=Obba rivulosa TaxID=1052685 RepID=A0A8E2DLL7_9APHY|nr:hypothetical protein OBBRIDRAFT_792039 [Obba rivulosa]
MSAPYHLAASPSPSCASASSLGGSMMDAVPLLDDGSPYQPAPLPGLLEPPRHRHSTGQCRVDLAPLRSLARNHPYRRCPADDRALRLLGPGAR